MRHLYAAFRALLAARTARGTLDLDLPERRVVLDDEGVVRSVAPRPRLDSHRLIEEFMVLANVAAAEELERLHQPVMYRVHAPPSEDKLASLRDFLHGLGISLPPGDQVHPRDLDRVLRRVADTPEAPAGQRGDAAQSVAGRVQPRQYRPFRPRPAALCAFHQSDPALRRSPGASRADPRAAAGRRRALPRTRPHASPTPRNTSPQPSVVPNSPSGTPSTVTLLHTWWTKLGRISLREFPV